MGRHFVEELSSYKLLSHALDFSKPREHTGYQGVKGDEGKGDSSFIETASIYIGRGREQRFPWIEIGRGGGVVWGGEGGWW